MSSSTTPPPRPLIRLGAGWWAWATVLVAGLVWLVVGDRVLDGGLLVAASFALAAVLRAVLPDDRVGGLHVRGRRRDILRNSGVAVAVALAVVLVHLREGT